MKRVTEYRKLFNIEGDIDLKELKTTYRNLIKDCHPDKFQDLDQKEEAEHKSKKIIDGYHFLMSIAPETQASNKEEYAITTSESSIIDFKHKGLLLEISFADGTTYEYFGVNKNIYNKFLNSDRQFRFAKRSIFHSYLYRKSKKDLVMA